MKTAEDFKNSATENNIHHWPVHDCSICGYECGFLFNYQGYEVIYDNGCDCTRRYVKHERTWQDVADQYHLNIKHAETIKKYNEYWNFNNE